MSILEGLRLVLGGLFVLFVPGFIWSYVFFARKQIDWIERVALSFGLSIALVPILVFWLNWLFHMRITLLNTSMAVVGLIILAIVIVLVKKYYWNEDTARRLKLVFRRDKNIAD